MLTQPTLSPFNLQPSCATLTLNYPPRTRSTTQNILKLLAILFFLFPIVSNLRQPSFRYHNNKWVGRYLKKVARTYPTISHLYSIGKSVKGQDLWVLALGYPAKHHVKLRPEVKFIGNIHGNEVVTRELMIHLIHYMTYNFNKNKLVTYLLNTTRLHVLVSMNPDGYRLAAKESQGTCYGLVGRNNHNKHDLNRNFPDFFHKQQSLQLQPETIAVMRWMRREQFVLSASLHGGAMVVNYPYDNIPPGLSGPRYSKSRDDDVFRYLASSYANKHPTMHLGVRCPGDHFRFPKGIVNGASWYLVKGSMQDYNYIKGGCMELTVEVACCKFPQESSLRNEWRNNKRPLLSLHSLVHTGVKGIVEESRGKAIKGAVVHIIGRDHPTKTTALGEFWRILLPGKYKIKVEVVGFPAVIHHFNIPPTQSDFMSDSRSVQKHFQVSTYLDQSQVTVLRFKLLHRINKSFSLRLQATCLSSIFHFVYLFFYV